MLAPLAGLPKQSEILIIIFLGICFQSLDFSLFEIRSNLEEIWKLQLHNKYETIVKYIISAVVLARTFTLHAFLACYVIMLWPAIFEEKPNLMLPWLLLGVIRSLILNAVTFIVGTFICYKEKGQSLICFEYILAQLIEHGPSVYAWISVLSFYRDLVVERASNQPSQESLLSETQGTIENRKDEPGESDFFWNKSKSLSDLNLDCLNNRFNTLANNVLIYLLIVELSNSIILRDRSKSFDSLQQDNSDTLDTFCDKKLTIIEKTMKVLEISDQDISNARQDKMLKEVSKEDTNKIDEVPLNIVSSPKFYIRKNQIYKGVKTHLPTALYLHEEANRRDSCMCSARRKLLKEQSQLSLIESEIANIKFDDPDDRDLDNIHSDQRLQSSCPARSESKNNRSCVANSKKLDEDFTTNFMKNDIPNALNRYRLLVGASLGFNRTNFLEKLALKKNTSKNFGCQVSLLQKIF